MKPLNNENNVLKRSLQNSSLVLLGLIVLFSDILPVQARKSSCAGKSSKKTLIRPPFWCYYCGKKLFNRLEQYKHNRHALGVQIGEGHCAPIKTYRERGVPLCCPLKGVAKK
jgi:hypothetical protein